MQNENMQTVGAYLKKNREMRGISLEEIASSTKININILSYLETDRFDKLPAPVFVKGFIKTYLKYLDVDAKEAVLFYELITSGNKPVDTQINKLTEKDVFHPKEKVNKRVLVASITISVIFAVLLIYHFSSSSSEDRSRNKMIVKMLPGGQKLPLQPQGITLAPSQDITAAQPAEQTAVQPVATQQAAQPPITQPAVPQVQVAQATPPVQTQPTDQVMVQPQQQAAPAPVLPPQPAQQVMIKTQKDVWLKAKLDESDPFDFLLRAGSFRKLEAKSEIKVLIGDASAVTVEYEGKTIENLGKEGNVRTLVFPGLGRWKDAMQ
jgi:cytoskeleton protein RodZ